MIPANATITGVVANGLRQSDVIFGCLVLAFLIFITARGELPKYIQVFF